MVIIKFSHSIHNTDNESHSLTRKKTPKNDNESCLYTSEISNINNESPPLTSELSNSENKSNTHQRYKC